MSEAESRCGMTARMTNWAGNIVYRAARVARPRSVSEAQDLVTAGGQVRAVGTGHSFNRIADTPGVLVSLAGLPPVIDIDPGARVVTVAAGIRYGELAAGSTSPAMPCPAWPRCRTCRWRGQSRPPPMARVMATGTWPRRCRAWS